ncbi:MAG TPA: energy transducer TonB [Bacteroidales bacterium]|jgi:protein TonB|nr:energy transducer TonB [Bacteroidales bacterium]
MANEKLRAPSFDEIVFENRNKEYGAYKLRKKYRPTVMLALLIAVVIIGSLIIGPYLNAKAAENRSKRAERTVEVKMEAMDAPVDQVAPPPPPPPPPADVVQQARYVPPVVVDSVKPEEDVQLMTADEAQTEVQNTEVVDIPQEVKEEVQEAEPEEVPFVVVEEMPMFPGGDVALLKYIGENTIYPEVAKENNIQGRVIVRFCVTAKGGVSQVSVLKGVDPELDKEAVRVVNTLPPFKPGKQGGKPVPVWYMVPITFTLK